MGKEPPCPFHPSEGVRNDAGCAEEEKYKVGKAALVKHFSAIWFSQTGLGELRIQHARLMSPGPPWPKRMCRFCTPGWQRCKMNDALFCRRPIGTCPGSHNEPDRSPNSLHQVIIPPTVENAPLKTSDFLTPSEPCLPSRFAVSPILGWQLCASSGKYLNALGCSIFCHFKAFATEICMRSEHTRRAEEASPSRAGPGELSPDLLHTA